MRVLFMGFFGKQNIGDDLMLEVFVNEFCKDVPAEFTLANLIGAMENLKLPDEIKVIDLSKLKHGKRFVFERLLSRRFDALFWIGGTCFTENAGDGSYYYMKAFQKREKITGYIGVGIGQVTSESKIRRYSELLRSATLVTFRDEESYNTALKWAPDSNLYLCDDLVYLSKPVSCSEKLSDDGSLVICWRCYEGYYPEQIEQKAINVLCRFVKGQYGRFSKIFVVVMGNEIDYKVNLLIYNKLQGLSLPIDVKFLSGIQNNERVHFIRKAKLIITGRLHAIFIAELNGVNTVAIGYDNKIERFLKSVKCESDLIYPDELTVDKLNDVARTVPNVKHDLIERNKEMAKKNIILFKNIIRGG